MHMGDVEGSPEAKGDTYSSVACKPSSYIISLDNDLNFAIDWLDNIPNRISFNISTNSAIGH